MKEQWVNKTDMINLLDTALTELEVIEEKISTKIDEAATGYWENQKETLRSIEQSIIEFEKVSNDFQQQAIPQQWKNSNSEVVLRPV